MLWEWRHVEGMMKAHEDGLRSRVVAVVAEGMSRRGSAARFLVSASSAVRWAQRQAETGSCSAMLRGGRSRSPLAPHTAWLLALVAEVPDLTLVEIAERVAQAHGLSTTESSLRRFFQRHRVTRKKNPACCRTGPSGRRRSAAIMAGRAGGI